MVPRPEVATLPEGMPLGELVSATTSGSYTRYPVHEDGMPGRVVGFLHLKDVLRTVGSEGGLDADVKARDLMRDVPVVPENRLVDEVLQYLQEQEVPMAVVVNEWGYFEGIITTEDIFEEIVGEIRDEFDEERPQVRELGDGSYAVDGRASLMDVNRALDSGFESETFDTIGGLVFGSLGRTPEVGDEVVLDGYTLRVEETDGPRVASLTARQNEEDGETNDS